MTISPPDAVIPLSSGPRRRLAPWPAGWHHEGMCRNIRVLHNFEPPATGDEVHEAALQYVRKISGSARPSKANEEAFARAVAEVTATTRSLLDDLVTTAAPKNREVEAVKARERARDRYAR